MIPVFTVVCYRPDGSDYSCGCLMGTSPSDFAIFEEETADSAGARVAEYRHKNHLAANEREVASWEITVLVNGSRYGTGEDQHTVAGLREAVDRIATEVQNELLENEAREKVEAQARIDAEAAAKRAKMEKAKEEHDRTEYERLRTKFGG